MRQRQKTRGFSALCLVLLLAALLAPATRFSRGAAGPRPELWLDDDMSDIPQPAEYQDALYWDFFNSTFGKIPKTVFKPGDSTPAWNVNAWDEAPDSSWYTNRNHLRPMSPEQIAQGANQGPGPDMSGTLTITRGKDAGASPGFGPTRDSRGNLYFIKFDSPEHPEISTTAEMIGSRLFHAMGFNVPQEWIVALRADQLQVDPKARLWDKKGQRRAMTRADVDEVLKGAARLPDGRYRAVLSLQLPGTPVGFFQFDGTRKDDPNDLIPHQHRRELRGLRLMSAWLNHYDIRVGNTLDAYVEEGGRKFLRHYLLDFGSTLGSASHFPKVPRMGNSYMVDFEQMFTPLITLGIVQPRWREHPVRAVHATLGPFDSESFSPRDWRSVFPVVAFDHMDASDAFWAAKVVMSFTEAQIRAAVKTGQLSDPRAEEALVRTLIERQRKVGRYGFSRVTTLDRFKVAGDGQALEFEDLAVRHGLADAATSWVLVEPESKSPKSVGGGRIPLLGAGAELRLASRRADGSHARPMTVYLERSGNGVRVRGWER